MPFFEFMRKTCYAIYKCNSVAIDEGINDSRNGNKNSFIAGDTTRHIMYTSCMFYPHLRYSKLFKI
jgi:hypothetical protein